MQIKRLIWFAVIVVVMAGIALAVGQRNDNQSEMLSRLRSGEWKERAGATEKLIANGSILKSDEVKNALIDLLERENQVIESTLRESNGLEGVSGKYGEGYSEYYSSLLGAVDQGADYSDERTLSILVHTAYNGDSPFALKLASYGARVAPILLEIANSDLATLRGTALEVLGEVLKLDKHRSIRLPPNVPEQIEQALIRGTRDQDVGVRILAVGSLGRAGGNETIELLESIAQSDPAFYLVGGAVKDRYPVREEALKSISLIRAEERRKPQ